MSYLVLARKYRPATFQSVIGQEHVTRTLINAIELNKVHHAYIFTGPRGVGKTTVSRILAKALNCETGITSSPCNKCQNCLDIDSDNCLDVKEVDGASNRGIDEIRGIRDEIKFTPASCRKKIYIIDEVHMLTNQAFNALLKTLEEPPEHAIFIFATTEINEVPATILSRCQRHDFKRVPADILVKSLKDICDNEGISIDKESLYMIAHAGDGSVRDSESVLDQVIAYSGNTITKEQTAESLGVAGYDVLFEFLDIKLEKDTKGLLNYIDKLAMKGINYEAFMKGLADFFRNFLILKAGAEQSLLTMTGENARKLEKYTKLYTDEDLLYYLDVVSKGFATLKNSGFQRIDFEIILLKIVLHEGSLRLSEIISRVDKLTSDLKYDPEKLLSELRPQINVIKEQRVEEIRITETRPLQENSKKEAVREKEVEIKEADESVLRETEQTQVDADLINEPLEQIDTNELPAKEIADSVDNLNPESSQDKKLQVSQEIANPEEELGSEENPEASIETLSGEEKVEKADSEEKIEEEAETNPSDQNKVLIEEVPEAQENNQNESLNLASIKDKWKIILNKMVEKYPSLAKFMDYPVPERFENNQLVLKFADKHNTYFKFCSIRRAEFSAAFNAILELEKKEKISVEFIQKDFPDQERIIKLKEEEKSLTQQEKQEILLKKAPQLKFLFEKPINGKIV